MRSEMNVTSNQAIIDWMNILEKKGFLIKQKNKIRSLIISQKAIPLEIKYNESEEKLYTDTPSNINFVSDVGVYNVQSNNFSNSIRF